MRSLNKICGSFFVGVGLRFFSSIGAASGPVQTSAGEKTGDSHISFNRELLPESNTKLFTQFDLVFLFKGFPQYLE